MVKVAALKQLTKGKFLLFVLALEHHQFLLQDLVLEIGLIPQLGCGLFKFSVHFSFFLLNRLIMAVELFALLLDNLDLLFDVLVVALGVAQGHLVLIQSADLVFKVLLHRLGFCKLRIQQLEIFLKNSHMNSVSFCVGLDLFPLLFVSLDKLQVFSCDVIVILLHLTECSFVVLHQLVDVLVFALFNLMDLNLLAQFEFGLQIFDLLFILLDVLRLFDFEGFGLFQHFRHVQCLEFVQMHLGTPEGSSLKNWGDGSERGEKYLWTGIQALMGSRVASWAAR